MNKKTIINPCAEPSRPALNFSEQKMTESETTSSNITNVPDLNTNQKSIVIDFDMSTKFNEKKITEQISGNTTMTPLLNSLGTSTCSIPTDSIQRNSPQVKSQPDIEQEKTDFTEFGKTKYQCKKCLKICSRSYSLKAHEKTHLNEPVMNYKCLHCDIFFSNAYDFKRHESQHDVNEKYKCKLCLFTCTRASSMSLHQKTHRVKPYKCKYCENCYTHEFNLKLHERGHIGQVGCVQIRCEACSKCFDRETSLKIHNQMQNSKKGSIKCKILCDQCFKDRSNLKKPETKVTKQTDRKSVKCKFCTKSFSLNTSLKIHEKRRHCNKIKNPLKSYKCVPCGKIFKDVLNLLSHSRIHTKRNSENLKGQKSITKKEKKPHQCMYCGKLFEKAYQVKEHERIHTGERPFQCLTCGQTFIRISVWKEHQQRHVTSYKPFKCEFCSKGFWRKPNLAKHTRIHTGDKPFACQYCGKLFIARTNRNQHERVHTGEKPYKCKYCDKTFSQTSNMRQHEKTHVVK
ncbi:unnamed protein product [Owenia fusiformis]|uniref:Uncharacterized protein n=1 Tax=Owenia fusiformis TaxID=6347 RepID=A0A8J1V0Z0_OWEFU|nr:unnamed protein product [Owenia fusiformis]